MIRRAFLVFLVFGVTVCGDDSTGPESVDDSTGPDESVVGTYTLQSVGGDALPWVLLQFLGDKVEVTAGSIILNQDMTCSSSTTSSVTESGNVTNHYRDGHVVAWRELSGGEGNSECLDA